LQDVGIQAITIHGRTKAQAYKGEADWTLIGEIKNNQRIKIPVFGNGDVNSAQKAFEMKKKYNVDGIMIGRAMIGNPWLFKEINHYFDTGELLPPPAIKERVEVCRIHLKNSIQWYGEKYGVVTLRQHYKGYFKGIPNLKPYYLKLVTLNNFEEIDKVLCEIAHVFN